VRPAFSSSPSTIPASLTASGAGAPGGGGASERPQPGEQALGLASPRIAPDTDRDLAAGAANPGQLGDRRGWIDRVLDRVERGDNVEHAAVERQTLDVTTPQIGRRRAPLRHLQEWFGCVDA
jgi:hypothetical protein